MELTQPLDWDVERDPDDSSSEAGETGHASRPVGRLHLFSSRYGPEKDFWIYLGENLIGRDESCQVCLPASSVSKVHAVIEVPSVGGPHLLYDRGSLNRTRRQRMVLLPRVRYSLQDGDTLFFGDVGCQYFVLIPERAPDSLDDFMGVPPTQPRVEPNAFAIEETPAPGRKMGFGGVLVQDSDKEEEGEEVVNGAGKTCRPPVSDGPDSFVRSKVEGHPDMASMFSSPSAVVVPESDEEGEEPSRSDLPDPSLRLNFENQDAEPNPLGCRAVTPPSHNGHLVQPEATESELKPVAELGERAAEEKGASAGGSCQDFHVDSDTDVEDENGTGSTSKVPPSGDSAKDIQVPQVDSDTDIDEPMTVNSEVDDQKVHRVAKDVSSGTDVEDEEGLGSTPRTPALGDSAKDKGLDVGSDTDTEEPLTVNFDTDSQKIHGTAVDVGSDTDVKDEERVGSISEMPVLGDSSKGSQELEVGRDTDEPTAMNLNAEGQKIHHVANDASSDTDVEEMRESPSVLGIHVSAGNKDDDTDVEGGTETPKQSQTEDGGTSVEDDLFRAKDANGIQQSHDDDGESDADTDVEMSNLVLDSSGIAGPCSPNPASCKDTGENMGQIPTGLQDKSSLGEGKHRGDNEATNVQSEDLDGKEHLPNPDDQGKVIATPQNQFLAIVSADSDTDVEEVADNPDADLNTSPGVTDLGHSGQSKESDSEKPYGGPPKSPADGDSDTDVEAEPKLLTEKPLEEQETQLISVGSWNDQKKPDRAAKNEDTGVEGSPLHPGSSSSTDDDSDLTFQATQCFLPTETSSPRPENLRNAAITENSSPFNSDDTDNYVLEATQLFCKESGHLLEVPTQSFIAKEEGETELVCQRPPEGEELSEQATLPVVSDPALGGQSGDSCLQNSPEQPCLEPALQRARGVVAEALKEKEEIQAVHSVHTHSVGSDQPLPLPQVKQQMRMVASEGGSTTGLSEEQNGAATVVDVLEAKSSAPSSKETDQLSEHAREDVAQPVVSASGRRRNLRSAAAAPSALAPKDRSHRQSPASSGKADAPNELGVPLTRRRGLRRLASPVQYMGEPEEVREPEGEVSPPKKPKSGEPTVGAHQGRTRCSQRETRGAVSLKEETATVAGSPGTEEPTRRRSQRLLSQSLEEQQPRPARTRASRRSSSTSVSTPSSKDSGKGDRIGQEPALSTSSTARKSRRPSTESKAAGRAQSRNSAASNISAPKVLFTGVIDEEGERVVTELGGCLAESVFDCTHLVTDRVRRTVKFLCAVARGIPIVTLDWLEKSRRNSFFLAPNSFLVCDPEQEKNFQFSLSESLQRARQRGGLLQGCEIHVTPNVKPEPEHMKDIIKCSGGTFLPRMPRSYKDKRIIISCPADLPRCKAAQDAGVPIANAELILMGILQQKVDVDAHRLDGVVSPSVVKPTTRTSKRRAAAAAPSRPSTAKRRR